MAKYQEADIASPKRERQKQFPQQIQAENLIFDPLQTCMLVSSLPTSLVQCANQ